ncbi:MAG: zinc-binding dehydrogenase, partial [Chthoniobacterales bacterium]
GADDVIDYTKKDFTQGAERYDVIIDNVGNRTIWKYLRVLNPHGHYVLIGGGGSDEQGLFGPLVGPLRLMLVSPFVSQKMSMLLANLNQKDFDILAGLMQKGKVKPVIDRRYKLTEIVEAIAYLEEGHARGKVVIAVEDKNEALTGASPRLLDKRTPPNPLLIAFKLIGLILGVIILPIVVAFVLNRRFQRRHPGKRGYRWGYYFSIQAFLIALLLASLLQLGIALMLAASLLYALMAWFFAQRKRWAWIALTILCFNPIAWLINLIYLWRRWTEDAARAAA